MSNTSEFITIIRPSFMKFCGDACRAAAFNHLLFRIAGKSKDQPKEKIQAGDILWYASTEQITEEMSHAWGVCKVRQQVNALIDMGIIGRRSNPSWGVDRTKHFCFGTAQCQKLLELLAQENICVVHLGLAAEVMHLIYSSNANDNSIKCSCQKEGANDKFIECIQQNYQMHRMNSSDAFDKFIEAIPIDIPTIDDNKEDNKGEEEVAQIVKQVTEAFPTPPLQPYQQQNEKTHLATLHSQWCDTYGPYGDTKWDREALEWIAERNGTFEDIQLVYAFLKQKKPGESVRPELVKNNWFRVSDLRKSKGGKSTLPEEVPLGMAAATMTQKDVDEEFYPIKSVDILSSQRDREQRAKEEQTPDMAALPRLPSVRSIRHAQDW